MHRAEENSARDMSRVLDNAKRLIDDHELGIVLIHHAGKNGEERAPINRLRGSSDIAAACRHIVLVESSGQANSANLEAIGNTSYSGGPFSVVFEDGEDELGRKVVRLSAADGQGLSDTISGLDEKILGALAGGAIGARELRKLVRAKSQNVTNRTKVLLGRGLVAKDEDGRLRLVETTVPGSRPQGREPGTVTVQQRKPAGSPQGNPGTPPGTSIETPGPISEDPSPQLSCSEDAWRATMARGRAIVDPEADRSREILNANEVADFLGLDRKTVYDAASRGEIPHQRLGRRLLFSRDALVEWLRCKGSSEG